MSGEIYPSTIRGLTFTVVKRPEFSTLIQRAPNLYELRLPQTVNPIWHFSLVYDYLKDFDIQPGLEYTDLRTLMGFFTRHRGAHDDFLFSDPDDNFMGPALAGDPLAPNPLAELQLVTDGVGTWYSPIQRNLGGFMEDITDLDGSITVYANGVLQEEGTDFNIGGPGLAIPGQSFAGLFLQWTSQPTPPITAEFNFFFRVRFENDHQDFEKFLNLTWTIGGHGGRGAGEVRLVTSRPANPPILLPAAAPKCDLLIPMPGPPDSGVERILINPRSVSDPMNVPLQGQKCCSSSGFADPNGLVPGSGVSHLCRRGPFSTSCPVSWWNFIPPAGIDPSQYYKIWAVMQAEYDDTGGALASGRLDIAGGGLFSTFAGFPRKTFVKNVTPSPPSSFDFASLSASANVEHSLGPADTQATVWVYAVTVVLDYIP